MRASAILISLAILCFALGGCGGRIAKTGWGRVTAVSPCGDMVLQYCDGSTEHKRIGPAGMPKGARIAAENLLTPARYVETDQGSTLTFPCKKTITYYNVDCD